MEKLRRTVAARLKGKSLERKTECEEVTAFFADYCRYIADDAHQSHSKAQVLLRNAFQATNGYALDVASVLARGHYATRASISEWPCKEATALALSDSEISDAVTSLKAKGWWLAPRLISEAPLVDLKRTV